MRSPGPAILFLVLATVGCIYPAERGKMLEERVDRLDVDKRALEQELKQQRSSLDEQVAQVQAALGKLEKTAHRTGADIGVQVEQLQADMMQLRGQVEQYQHQLGEVQAALDKLKAAPPAAPASSAEAAPSAADSPHRKPEPVKRPELEKPTDRRGLAQLAEKTLGDDAAAGRKLAEEWLKKYARPDSAADQRAWSPLAARMHYLLGSSLAAHKEWRAALSELGEIVKSFAKSEEAPDALLKSSECFAALKMPEESRLALEELVNAYPKSEAAKVAKTRLADSKKPKPAAAPAPAKAPAPGKKK